MDKFVAKTPSSSLEKDRASKYPKGTFYVYNDLLFSSSCNIVVHHLQKCVIDKHLEAKSLKQNAEKKNGKQPTLKTVLNCKTTAQIEKFVFV